jgi:hypothetical protein
MATFADLQLAELEDRPPLIISEKVIREVYEKPSRINEGNIYPCRTIATDRQG